MTAGSTRRRTAYVPNRERGTVRVEVRCQPALAAKARAVARERGLTLADVLDAGVDALTGEDAS